MKNIQQGEVRATAVFGVGNRVRAVVGNGVWARVRVSERFRVRVN